VPWTFLVFSCWVWVGWNLSVRNASAQQLAGAWEKDGCRSWSDARLKSSVFWISYHGTTLLPIIGHFSYLLSGDLVVCQCLRWKWPCFRGKSSTHHLQTGQFLIANCKLLNVQRVTIPNSDKLLLHESGSPVGVSATAGLEIERLRMFDWICGFRTFQIYKLSVSRWKIKSGGDGIAG